MGMTMDRKNISLNHNQRSAWLQDCVTMFREAVLMRRAVTHRSIPECIAQIAMEFGIGERRGRKFFYNELFSISRETWLLMKFAALRGCDADVRLLHERLEARRARKRQYELELSGDPECGCGGSIGHASALSKRTDMWTLPTDGSSDY